MDFNQLKINVAHLKGIITSQTQVRTNKLKPYIEFLEEVAEYIGNGVDAPAIEAEAITPNTDPERNMDKLDHILLNLSNAERSEMQRKLNAGDDPKNSEIERLSDFILTNYPDEPGKIGESESAVDVAIRLLDPKDGIAKENKYLKRKLTMYDLKIAKMEQEVKKWRSMAKGSNVTE